MKRRPEILIGEVAKSKTDAFRVTVASQREGRTVNVAVVHRFAGGQSEVPGHRLTCRPEHVDGLVDALRRAKDAATGASAAAALLA